MALTITELKALWKNGFIPDENNYADLFDTIFSIDEDSGFQNITLNAASSGIVQYRTRGKQVHLRFINYVKGNGVFDSFPLEIAPLSGNTEGSYFLIHDSELTGEIVKLFVNGGIINPQETSGVPFIETPNITADIYYFI